MESMIKWSLHQLYLNFKSLELLKIWSKIFGEKDSVMLKW